MNNELFNLGQEIQKLRTALETTSQKYNTLAKEKREHDRQIDDEIEKIRAAAQAAILELSQKRQEKKNELDDIYSELNKYRSDIEEKNKLYAKLLEAQNEAEQIEELKKTIDEICLDFESYFKAHIYQHEDIAFTVKAYLDGKNGVLNANDMGLGKTYESTVCLYILAELFKRENGRKPRILWLTKKSLVSSTPNEIRKWWPEVKIFSSATSTTEKQREFLVEMYVLAGDILLANYEFVRTTKLAADITWDLIVIDEVHKLKGGANSTPTAIWKAVKDVCINARFTLMLSGTPMVNRAEEMWSYLHIFSPERFPSIRDFERNFVGLRNIAGEMKLAVDPEKLLRGALKGQMIRRRRDEVGLQLPEITREFIELEMNPEQKKVYDQMRSAFFVWLDEAHERPLTATAIIAQLTRLRQINVWPAGIKITDENNHEIHLDVQDSSKIDFCMDSIESNQDQTVVFCTFNEPLYEVKRRAEAMGLTCEVVSGATVKHMGEYERRFQQKELDVICINSAMGEGLNLQKNPDFWPGGSSLGIFLDWWWTPARNEQCEARIHRQGANQTVQILMLENVPSIDAFIIDKNHEKKSIFADITESDAIRPASEWRTYLEGVL